MVDLEQEVDGMSMIDMEGIITATEVTAHFSETGVPETIEAKYKMKSDEEWDRFIRFMERYAQSHGLSFVPSPTKILYDIFTSEAEEAALDPKEW